MGVVVEKDVGVVATTAEENFEVYMLGGGMARAADETDDLSGFHLLSYLHVVLRLMAVESDESVAVLYLDAVAVTAVIARLDDLSIEGSEDIVVGFCLNVNT